MGGATILFYRYYLMVYRHQVGWLVKETSQPEGTFGYQEGTFGYQEGTVAVSEQAYPLGVAVRVARELSRKVALCREVTLGKLERWGRKAVSHAPEYPPPRFNWARPVFGKTEGLNEAQRGFLAGRLLSGMELSAVMRRFLDLSPGEWERCLQVEVNKDNAERYPGVVRDEVGRLACARCGETEYLEEVACNFCGGRCYTCLACQCFGPTRECIPLYRFYSREVAVCPERLELAMPALTSAQEIAALKVADFCREGSGEFLVWAVCGAGKTEVVFPAIREALLRKERVLYAVPRRDVVREMGRRFARAFPDLNINILHGGEGRVESSDAPLTIATTHQVLRFVEHFDLAILDEADAYPYEGSRMLRYGLQRAVRSVGRVIMMTATPDGELRQKVAEERIGCVRIPGRHHGQPLPVPVLLEDELPLGQLMAGDDLPPIVRKYLLSWTEEKLPVLVFLPTVGAVRNFGRYLQHIPEFLSTPFEWVHAGHPQRDQIVEDFRAGKLRVMVTTTLLERGVNFPGVQVMVLFADDERVFDTECLVQIAGRAGRYASHPCGEVVFIGNGISQAMREAGEWIRDMNLEARQKGLLDDLTSI